MVGRVIADEYQAVRVLLAVYKEGLGLLFRLLNHRAQSLNLQRTLLSEVKRL